MNLALAGGGSQHDSAFIDQRFADWIGPQGKLLYLPIALGWERAKYEQAVRWIRSVFAPMGIQTILTWTNLRNHAVGELDEFDGLYIGGGNAYHLLQELRSKGFLEAIKCYAANGRSIYGGSAGAVVLGKTIATVSHLDSNEKGIRDLAGLDLIGGYSVWVHFKGTDPPLIERFISEQDERLIVLSERAAIAIENGELRSVGTDPAYAVDQTGWKALP